jgi:putative ABC transport system substrate-binding protein
MDRRRFLLSSLAAALVGPRAAAGQSGGKVPRIGWLTNSIVHSPNVEAFRAGMRAVGYPEVQDAARTLGIHIQSIAAADMAEMERGLGSAARNAPGALLIVADAFLWSQRVRIVSLASRLHLPGMYPEREFVVDGGLMAYGISVSDNFRRAAGYVDRILKGTRPADLPVEQPATFELTINMRTAKTLGLTIPAALLLRADRLIE